VWLRRFGSYSLQAVDPVQLIRKMSGCNPRFAVGEMSEQLRNLIVNRLADLLGEWPRPMLDLAAEFNELGRILRLRLAEEWASYGLKLTSLLTENLSLP
jgi:membrane protease subunit (stomatin/prohibitin family)